ncbi:MAG TPA: hypothetical protein VFZ12_00335 [Dehalococcoidia bacterium]|nr:hypothetical protein [Dehalococcoidia bacterium]
MQAVLFLHGRGPKPPADALREQWLESLPTLKAIDGEGRLPIGMLYWADVAESIEPAASDVDWVSGHLVGRAFLEIDGKPGLGHDDSAGREVGRGSAASMVYDVANYFRKDPAFRDAVRARVREAIEHVAEHVDSILLLAHELGAVIAYEILTHRRYMPGGGEFVDLGDQTRAKISLVTMGSPLGWVYDAELTQYVRRSSKTFPRGLNSWLNVFDERDPIAAPPFMADPTLADEFSTFEHNAEDQVVENPARMPNSVYGYLSTEPVANTVAAFLGSTGAVPAPSPAS